MDNNNSKGVPRSHHAGFEPQTTPQTGRRPQRKPAKKSQNVVCDNRPHHVQNNEHMPLFNNRSLSILSTMHHLNPHRKVAISPEILREAEEQANTLRKAVKQLQEQLEKTNREKARIHRFLSDLLYTLNARGYESVQDHEGTVVDLNKCKGESYLELKGRDLKQRVNVRRQGGQEFLLKAVIGNQERAIQSLVYKLDSIGRDMILGNRLSIEDGDSSNPTAHHESAKIASLESEVLQLVNLIEGACQKCPDMYSALRDQYYLNEPNDGSDLSPRNPVIHNLLRKCEQIAGDAQSRQLVVDILGDGTKPRPRNQNQQNAQPNGASNSAPNTGKVSKSRPNSKPKSAAGGARPPRQVASEMGTLSSGGPPSPGWSQNDYYNSQPHGLQGSCSETGPIQPDAGSVTGGTRMDGTLKHKGVSIRFPRSLSPGVNHSTSDNCNGADNGTSYGSSATNQSSHDCSVTVCPYCHRRFGLEESISEIKNHIEMHIFAVIEFQNMLRQKRA